MKLYLDIDGVLLNKDGTPAKDLKQFIKHMVDNNTCYWLTTHCRFGDNKYVLDYLRNRVDVETFSYIEKIKVNTWDVLKTEGIDFSSDFLWFDDNLFESEKKVLIENGVEEKMVMVNLNEIDGLEELIID